MSLKLQKVPLTQDINFWLNQHLRIQLCHLRMKIMLAKKSSSYTPLNTQLENQSSQTK